jgi:hypothetical protein
METKQIARVQKSFWAVPLWCEAKRGLIGSPSPM